LFIKGEIKMTRFRIFTDGGAFKKEDGKSFTGVSSYCVYKNDDEKPIIERTVIHENGTNNYSEIFAIASALKEIYEYIKVGEFDNYQIEVYSDSMWCIKSLTVWIWNWLKNSKPGGVLINSMKQKVANQEFIKEAFYYLQQFKSKCKIYFINSHQPESKIAEQYKKFKKDNNVDITLEDFIFAYLNNANRDKAIKEAYKKLNENDK